MRRVGRPPAPPERVRSQTRGSPLRLTCGRPSLFGAAAHATRVCEIPDTRAKARRYVASRQRRCVGPSYGPITASRCKAATCARTTGTGHVEFSEPLHAARPPYPVQSGAATRSVNSTRHTSYGRPGDARRHWRRRRHAVCLIQSKWNCALRRQAEKMARKVHSLTRTGSYWRIGKPLTSGYNCGATSRARVTRRSRRSKAICLSAGGPIPDLR